jgi:hypothetical protein
MTGVLPSIALTCILSLSSLAVVMLRVSPLSSPEFALPFFFISIFIAVASCVTLILLLIKDYVAHQPLRSRQFVGSSLRQGIFVATGTCCIVLLHLLHILNWWIALLIYAVFFLIEMAIGR